MTMPRLAFNRKDTGGESIGGKVPRGPFQPATPETLSLWRYRGRPVIPGRALFGTNPESRGNPDFWIPGLRPRTALRADPMARPGMTVHIAS
jgi:hypothetical protein